MPRAPTVWVNPCARSARDRTTGVGRAGLDREGRAISAPFGPSLPGPPDVANERGERGDTTDGEPRTGRAVGQTAGDKPPAAAGIVPDPQAMEEDASASRGVVRERVLVGRGLAGPVVPLDDRRLAALVRHRADHHRGYPAIAGRERDGVARFELGLRAARAAWRPWAALCLATAACRDGVLVTGGRTPRWPNQAPRVFALQPWAAVQKAMGGSHSASPAHGPHEAPHHKRNQSAC